MKERTERDLARQMYSEGRTYDEIVSSTGAAKSTVSKWCSDLAAERRAQSMAATAERRAKAKLERRTIAVVRDDKVVREPRPLVSRPAEHPYAGLSLYEYDRGVGLVRYQLTGRGEKKLNFHLSRARYNMAVSLGRRLRPDERVLHVSEDVRDDRIENLRLKIHGETEPRPVVMKPCKNCQQEFKPSFTHRRYCSVECSTASMAARVCAAPKKIYRPRKVMNECVICEKTFEASKSGVDTCSRECRGVLLKYIAQGR